MKVNLHLALQALGFIISAATMLEGSAFLPMKVIPFIVLTVSAAQGLMAWLNHYYTPQGVRIHE